MFESNNNHTSLSNIADEVNHLITNVYKLVFIILQVGSTLLHFANKVEIVTYLLDKGANINTKNKVIDSINKHFI